MAAFRKVLLVLAVAFIATAGAGTAFAQFHPGVNAQLSCNSFAVPADARAEGIAELLGDVVIQCVLVNPQTGFPPSIQANVSVSLNVNVTNNRDFGFGGNTTDAVLLVNEVLTPAPVATSVLSSVPNTPGPQYGTFVSPATLQWPGVILPVPGVGGNPSVTTLRISNMRGNVSQLGIPQGEGTFPTAQVTAFVTITSQTAIPVSNNVLNVAAPRVGLLTLVRGPYLGGSDQTGTASDLPIIALQCLSQFVDRDNNIRRNRDGSGGAIPHTVSRTTFSSTDPGGAFSIRLSEGYASSFKTLGIPTVTPAAAQVERGFPTPTSNCVGQGSGPSGSLATDCGGATQGTRFIIRFYNVPSGVRIATPTVVEGTTIGGHTLRLVKVANTDSNGAGLLTTVGAPTEVTISGGSGFVVYEVIDSNPFAVEFVIVPIWAAYRANTGSDLPAIGTMQVSASFAPTSTVTTSNAGAPEPRFVETGTPTSVLSIVRCVTNILFPFVTNQGGFDTGLAIANTSSDDKGTQAQAGTCTLYYFGGTTGGGAAPPNDTTAVVASGAHIVWTLSGGNTAADITATPGFQGYIFAQCNFQFAHGFAFITDGFGGVPTIAEGYLALVVPWNGRPGDRFAGPGESLGH